MSEVYQGGDRNYSKFGHAYSAKITLIKCTHASSRPDHGASVAHAATEFRCTSSGALSHAPRQRQHVQPYRSRKVAHRRAEADAILEEQVVRPDKAGGGITVTASVDIERVML